MERVLDPIFTARKAQGAFDTVVLATQEGDVLYASGRRVQELRSSGLATLRRSEASVAALRRAAFASTGVDNMSIAGVEYKLFIQPCCAPTLARGSRWFWPASSNPTRSDRRAGRSRRHS